MKNLGKFRVDISPQFKESANVWQGEFLGIKYYAFKALNGWQVFTSCLGQSQEGLRTRSEAEEEIRWLIKDFRDELKPNESTVEESLGRHARLLYYPCKLA